MECIVERAAASYSHLDVYRNKFRHFHPTIVPKKILPKPAVYFGPISHGSASQRLSYSMPHAILP